MEYETIINEDFNGNFKITIVHKTDDGEYHIEPLVEDGVKWETSRMGSAAKLTFKVYKSEDDSVLDFQEGDEVVFTYEIPEIHGGGDFELFRGRVFSKKRSKDRLINVVAYDLLRYFQNKDTYVYKNQRASDIVKYYTKQFNFIIGLIDDTPYVIGSRSEDNQTVMDIIQNALDLTTAHTNKIYVLYSTGGRVCLLPAEELQTDLVINESTAEDFDYESSIDSDVYNEIELYYDNDETNKRDWYIAHSDNSKSQWGVLRYTDNIQNPANGQDRANKLLNLYNKKHRTLKVKNAFGHHLCMAGRSVIVNLKLGDIEVNNYMLIEKATHTFKQDEYRMDLTLSDKEFSE